MKRKTKYLTANKRNKAAQRAYDNKTLRDTYIEIRCDDEFCDSTDIEIENWHVLYFDENGTESTYATDLSWVEAKKLVKERNKRDPLPNSIMKHLAF